MAGQNLKKKPSGLGNVPVEQPPADVDEVPRTKDESAKQTGIVNSPAKKPA